MGDSTAEGASNPGGNVPLGSLAHAQNLLRLLYKDRGFSIDGLLGQAVTSEFASDLSATNFAGMFILLDEVIAVYHNLNLALIASIAQDTEQAPFNYRFSNSALGSLCAVRLLLTKGLDLEARVQLRALREIMVAWLFFDKFPDKRASFSEPQTLQEANHFWYKNLRGAEKALKGASKAGSFHPHMDGKLVEIEQMLNTAAHPSWVGLDVAARSNFHNASDYITSRSISNISLFSLSTALTFAALGYDPVKPVKFSVPNALAHLFPRHAACTEVNDMLVNLQRMPGVIFLYACLFAEHLSPGR